MTARWIDNHCHLHDARIPGGVEAAVASAREQGVVAMITVGCDRQTSLDAIAVAERFDDVWATVGLHPHDAVDGTDSITDLLDHPRVIAVGECGLDFHYDHSPRDVQRDAFVAQIRLARDLGRPLIIHTREAWEETFEILGEVGVPERTIFHCFTGGVAEAERCLALGPGTFLSFSGIVTFRTATDIQAAARVCPSDRLLIETDSPYLAPVPYRGRPNQPAHVTAVGQFLADLRGEDVEDVADASVRAACLAFPTLAP